MILITGILGQLGYDLAKELTKRGVEYIAPSLEELELTTEAGAKNFILEKKPEV
ncbi:MAG: sugar nucleotide-binding protein, partial [Selenomonadaceae bacterium]|nr:sugar nucleotide-binding protein [Selenomonadaceae bacterium]